MGTNATETTTESNDLATSTSGDDAGLSLTRQAPAAATASIVLDDAASRVWNDLADVEAFQDALEVRRCPRRRERTNVPRPTRSPRRRRRRRAPRRVPDARREDGARRPASAVRPSPRDAASRSRSLADRRRRRGGDAVRAHRRGHADDRGPGRSGVPRASRVDAARRLSPRRDPRSRRGRPPRRDRSRPALASRDPPVGPPR